MNTSQHAENHVFSRTLFILFLVSTLALLISTSQAQSLKSFRIGAIDFFGAQGQNLSNIRKALPVHPGQLLPQAKVHQVLDDIRASILASYGARPTDVALVCCDRPGSPDIYIGLRGTSYAALDYAKSPTGTATLRPQALALDRESSSAWDASVAQGDASEDDTHGYTLSKNPTLRAVQLRMRSYALAHSEMITRVLRESADPRQRRAAATLLGYSNRSSSQIRALTAAASDPDQEVRNNAIRALGVLAAAAPLDGVDASPFIRMLFSGRWSDRNKASFLLMQLTARRNPKLLDQLRRTALPPLIDGANWHSAGHAYSFLIILGRIGGIEESKLASMIDAGAKDQIIAAAEGQSRQARLYSGTP